MTRAESPVMNHVGEPRRVSGRRSDEVSKVLGKDFPLQHSARRVIVILAENDLQTCQYDLPPEERKFLYDPESFVLIYPTLAAGLECKAMQNIIDADLVRPGTVLVQSPYDRDAYVDLAQAADQFAVEKIRHFSRLCQYLGARDVTVEQVEISKDSMSHVYSMKAKAAAWGADGKVENQEESRLARKFTINTVFRGGKPDTEAAERYLRSKQLWGDVVMRSLVEQCADENNRMLEQSVTISLSSESKKTLGVVAKLKLPARSLGVDASYLKIAESSEEYSLTLSVKFDE